MFYLIFFVIFFGFTTYFLESIGFEKNNSAGISLIFTTFLTFFLWKFVKIKQEEIIYNAVKEHYDTLCIKRDQSIYYDDYGNEITEGFVNELIYFVENVVFPNQHLPREDVLCFAQITANMMDKVQAKRPHDPDDDIEESFNFLEEASPDPYEFEGNCKKILEKVGWEARTTPKSGDQGVDVIAKKDEILIVVQCKFYSQPVGNKAVQEIVAGKTYYKADYAVVVTNNTYTKSARQLAKSCGVVLLNVRQLKKIDEYLE